MPTYSYLCDPEKTGCGTKWKEHKAIHDRHNVMCPYCSAEGMTLNVPMDGKRVSKITILIDSPPQVINSLTSQDGFNGDSIPMPTLAPNADGSVRRIRSRRDLKEAMEQSREALFNKTDGTRTVVRPFKKDNGEVVFESETIECKGYDNGGYVPVDRADGPSGPDEAKMVEDTKKRVAKMMKEG